MTDNRRVSYFYDAEVGNYHYGQGMYGVSAPQDLRVGGFLDVSKYANCEPNAFLAIFCVAKPIFLF